jgi:hypothetical protein
LFQSIRLPRRVEKSSTSSCHITHGQNFHDSDSGFADGPTTTKPGSVQAQTKQDSAVKQIWPSTGLNALNLSLRDSLWHAWICLPLSLSPICSLFFWVWRTDSRPQRKATMEFTASLLSLQNVAHPPIDAVAGSARRAKGERRSASEFRALSPFSSPKCLLNSAADLQPIPIVGCFCHCRAFELERCGASWSDRRATAGNSSGGRGKNACVASPRIGFRCLRSVQLADRRDRWVRRENAPFCES